MQHQRGVPNCDVVATNGFRLALTTLYRQGFTSGIALELDSLTRAAAVQMNLETVGMGMEDRGERHFK